MITDRETNFVYFSGLLKEKCPNVFRELLGWFERLAINYALLPATKDIWVVDFMPLQVRKDYFLQYTYNPDYLKSKKEQPTKSDPAAVCAQIGLTPNKVTIVLDGGNVVKSKRKVILTTKVFKENAGYPEHNLIAEIKNQLCVEQVIIIPQEPRDFVGHSDGMVRFIDEDTVLLNQYPKDKNYEEFGYTLRWSLRNAGLHYVELPYTSWQNRDENDATGCYINFLEVGHYIFHPTFGLPEDGAALEQMKKVFKDRKLIAVDCRELAKCGGVLNCATWNILKKWK
jgi:agmatine deiminase